MVLASLLAFLAMAMACGDDGSDDGASPDAAIDPGSGAWQALPDVMGGAIQEIGVAELDGKIYVVGGYNAGLQIVPDVRVFDIAAGTWSDAAPLPAAIHHGNVAATGGKLYVLGALVGNSFTQTGISWVYDPGLDEWKEIAPMPALDARGAGTVGVIDGTIYIAGGFRDGVAVTHVSAYDPLQNTWDDQLPDLPRPSDHLVGAVVDGVFYAIGGRSGGINGISGLTVAYDPATPAGWETRAALPTPRGGMAAGVVDDTIIVVGGEGNRGSATGVFAQTERYDPANDEWTALAPMRPARHGMGAAGFDGKLYVPGGATRQGFGAVATFEVFVPAE